MNPSQTSGALSEKEMIYRIVSGEIKLYEAIIHRYNGYLYKIGRSYGFGHADVEDLMQETYINAYINLGKFENRSSFKTWIVRIMLNQCYRQKHKASFTNERPLENELRETSATVFHQQDKDVSKMAQNKELQQVLENAIQDIPEDYRTVFTLRELNGMSVRETSKALQISEDNVKVRFHRSKSMLRDVIKKTYSPEEIFEFNLIYCDKMVERVMKAIRKLNRND
ncbi:sigma-70 family RNA polymerase sigma factor [Flavobacteriaceae bacterium F89]|uniref:Sigma-70 family RNA polymerase sigma factor n=1 Tax=Cerina litoralis TaxID=2874477 RepID=A0AAE3EWT2_9FLAO|nr:sigma-70 family RNA polymerase sigma factor [Cerina litoralis]MCG2462537.1 sigma-70 family RNA polymerase sigma factor [Cerina litoralis]